MDQITIFTKISLLSEKSTISYIPTNYRELLPLKGPTKQRKDTTAFYYQCIVSILFHHFSAITFCIDQKIKSLYGLVYLALYH